MRGLKEGSLGAFGVALRHITLGETKLQLPLGVTI